MTAKMRVYVLRLCFIESPCLNLDSSSLRIPDSEQLEPSTASIMFLDEERFRGCLNHDTIFRRQLIREYLESRACALPLVGDASNSFGGSEPFFFSVLVIILQKRVFTTEENIDLALTISLLFSDLAEDIFEDTQYILVFRLAWEGFADAESDVDVLEACERSWHV